MPEKLKILIVDDIFINHVILESILIEMGHKVKCVKTGLSAIESLKRDDYDLILMDINMPKMDGKSATRIIRELTTPKSKIPIIACTADATERHMKEYREIGMNGLIVKPVVKEDLINALNNCRTGGLYFPDKAKKDIDANKNSDNNAVKTTEILGKLLKAISG